MMLNANMSAQDCLDAGFAVGWTRHLAKPDRATTFGKTLDFGAPPQGNLALSHDRFFAIVCRPIMLTDNPESDDHVWSALLRLGEDGFAAKIGTTLLYRVFKLRDFEHVRYAEIGHGALGGAIVTDRFLVPGARILDDNMGLLTAEIVNGWDEIKAVPTALKTELASMGAMREAWS